MARRFPTGAANSGQGRASGVRVDRRALDRQVDELCENFDAYLIEFNGAPPFTDTQVSYHIATLDLRSKLGSVAKSVDSDEFLHALYSTLDAWGMNSARGGNGRGSRLQEYDRFAASVRAHKGGIAALERVGAAQIDADVARRLWRIIQGMRLSQTQSQTVTGAKALHHLLPRLLPPIDRGYTQPFFRYSNPQFQYNQETAFGLMLEYFARIAQQVDLGRYVGTARWATSESKLIDNAIIGFCRLHLGLMRRYKGRDRIYKNGVAVEAQAHIDGCGSCKAVVGA